MVIEKRRQSSISIYLGITLLGGLLASHGVSQTAQTQIPAAKTQAHPVSLEHLYWHFLVYQNHLDTKADEFSAQGKDSTLMRGHLEKQLGFSDGDFAPIRKSSKRLSAEINALDAKAATFRAEPLSTDRFNKLHALTLEREADIQAEIAYLKQTLSPAQISQLEAFLTQLFSPANAVARPTPVAGQAVPAVSR
jgi:hypothetical protein